MTVKELAKDDDIAILPADKGRQWSTVVMDRKDYSAEMLMMLGDRDTYQLMAKDPTTSLKNRMNSDLLRLRREGCLSGKTYYQLRSSAAGVHVSMGCPRSTSLMSNCILCVLTHVCTIQVSCHLAVTNCRPF